MKGNCGECGRRWYCETNPDDCDEWPDPVPMTNAQKIRSMTDEELAELIVVRIKDMHHQGVRELAYSAWLEWLQQPPKGE